MSVSYTASLPVRDQTVLYVSSLLHAERSTPRSPRPDPVHWPLLPTRAGSDVRRGTRKGSRVLTPFKQAVLVLRWFLDGTRVRQLTVDNAIGKSTVYAYLDE